MRLLILALAVMLSGCAVSRNGEKVFADKAYVQRDSRVLKLDLFVPQSKSPPPVIVWFHGGGWRYGNKRYRLLVRALTDDGFAVASVQYRLSFQAKWPAQREDSLSAIRWLRSHSRELGIDASRMGLAGDSAGGHLASLLGVLEGSPSIRAVLAIYPPTDLDLLSAHYGYRRYGLITELLGAPVSERPDLAAEASPVTWVDSRAPAFLFIHGDRDPIVPLNQSEALARKLASHGAEARIIVAKGKGHAFALDRGQLSAVSGFFATHLKAGALTPTGLPSSSSSTRR